MMMGKLPEPRYARCRVSKRHGAKLIDQATEMPSRLLVYKYIIRRELASEE